MPSDVGRARAIVQMTPASALLTTANVVSVQASVQSFFSRPGAPSVHDLHIEVIFDPGDTPSETWTDPWQQITAPKLEWLASALRTAGSFRNTLVELIALGFGVTQRSAFTTLFATCGARWRRCTSK